MSVSKNTPKITAISASEKMYVPHMPENASHARNITPVTLFTTLFISFRIFIRLFLTSNGCSEDSISRPTACEPRIESKLAHPKYFCPLADTMFFPSEGENLVRPFISGLFKWGRPPTVFFAIVAVVVYTLKSRSITTILFHMQHVGFVHVGVKCLKTLPETLNSSPTVVVKLVRVGVVDPSTHRTKLFVENFNLVFARKTVGLLSFTSLINTQTTTRFGVLPLQGISRDYCALTAQTPAGPLSLPEFITRCSACYSQTSEFLSRQINKFTHKITIKIAKRFRRLAISTPHLNRETIPIYQTPSNLSITPQLACG